MRALLRLFNLRPRDKRAFFLLGPLFLGVTCANVVTLSFAKAFFVANNDVASLPWMFLAAAGFTAILSMLYVRFMGAGTRVQRFHRLLLFTGASFATLGLVVGPAGDAISLALFAWVAGMGHLILIQTWAFSSVLLPTRQANRLFPIFAASSTLGAALGGLLVTTVAAALGSAGLLFIAAALLVASSGVLARAQRVIQSASAKEEQQPPEDDSAPLPAKGAMDVVRQIWGHSLLRAIAILVFGLQLASTLLDYQFTASLKQSFESETELAEFFGLYYGLANAITFGLALLTGSRLTRWFGMGLAASLGAITLVIGGAVGAVLFFRDDPTMVWAIIATSFVERILSFAVGRQAIQAAMSPIDQNIAERAKFIIEGVVYKGATILVSLLFLAAPALLLNPGSLSLGVMVCAAIALMAGVRLSPRYREHLEAALKSRRVFAFDAATSWARREALRKVLPLLQGDTSSAVDEGLAYIRELRVRLPAPVLDHLLHHANPRCVLATLSTLAHTKQPVPVAFVTQGLAPEQDTEVVLALLRLLPTRPEEHIGALEMLKKHPNASVATLATLRLGGGPDLPRLNQATVNYDLELLRQATHPTPAVHRPAFEAIGQSQQTEYIEPLIDLLEHQALRRQAIATLARLPSQALVDAIAQRNNTSPHQGVAVQVWFVQALESAGTAPAIHSLLGMLSHDSETVKGQAVHALWRLSRHPDGLVISKERVEEAISMELHKLGGLSFLSALLSANSSPRLRFVRREVRVLEVRAERRIFRLLGIHHNRDAIERTFRHYRDPNKRTRSNAIELLDHTLGGSDHRAFIDYIEATETHKDFKTTLRSGTTFHRDFHKMVRGATQRGEDPGFTLLADHSPWLNRLYRWAAPDAALREHVTPFEEELMKRVHLLHQTNIFSAISGSELAILANVARPVEFEPGEPVFWQGERGDAVYIITHGSAHVLFGLDRIATMGAGDCFGEMALVEHDTRSATVQASEAGYLRCLRISDVEFQDMLEIYPSIAKGIITVLVQRLRRALKAKDARKEIRSRLKATLVWER